MGSDCCTDQLNDLDQLLNSLGFSLLMGKASFVAMIRPEVMQVKGPIP